MTVLVSRATDGSYPPAKGLRVLRMSVCKGEQRGVTCELGLGLYSV